MKVGPAKLKTSCAFEGGGGGWEGGGGGSGDMLPKNVLKDNTSNTTIFQAKCIVLLLHCRTKNVNRL